MADPSPAAFVLNTTRTPSAAYLMLHRANCWTITRLQPRATTFTGDYSKLCGGRDELEARARRLGGTAQHRALPLIGICLSPHMTVCGMSVCPQRVPHAGVLGVEWSYLSCKKPYTNLLILDFRGALEPGPDGWRCPSQRRPLCRSEPRSWP